MTRASAARRIVGCVGLLLSCTGEPTQEAPRLRVVLVGDSITAGLVSHPKGPSYAEVLSARLGAEFDVRNVGCGGTSSLDWTRSRPYKMCGGEAALPTLYDARVPPLLPAAFVTVLLGTNDSQGVQEKKRVPAEQYGAALREIATNLLEDGAEQVVLLGPPLVVHRLRSMMRVVEYGKQLRAVCEELPGVVCGPDVRFLLQPEDFAEGNVHPNASGHAKIADALAEALLALAQARDSDASTGSSAEGSGQTRSAPADSSSDRLP